MASPLPGGKLPRWYSDVASLSWPAFEVVLTNRGLAKIIRYFNRWQL